MPFSPTPHSAGGPSAGHGGSSSLFHRHDKHSPSPPATQPAVNKRDKRRIVIQDRLADIVQSFAENRDTNYRKQLQQYQADINFINCAQLYNDKPLLEPGEDEEEEVVVNTTRQQQASLQTGGARVESQAKTSRFATRFVQDVDDAMEERDVNLTATVVSSIVSAFAQAFQKIIKPELTDRSTTSILSSNNMRKTTNSLSISLR